MNDTIRREQNEDAILNNEISDETLERAAATGQAGMQIPPFPAQSSAFLSRRPDGSGI